MLSSTIPPMHGSIRISILKDHFNGAITEKSSRLTDIRLCTIMSSLHDRHFTGGHVSWSIPSHAWIQSFILCVRILTVAYVFFYCCELILFLLGLVLFDFLTFHMLFRKAYWPCGLPFALCSLTVADVILILATRGELILLDFRCLPPAT